MAIRKVATGLIGGLIVLWSSAGLAEPGCSNSQPLGLIGHAQSVGNYAIGIDVQGEYAFVGDWNQGSYHPYAGVFQVFDVSDPCNPTRLPGSVETTTPGFHEIGDLAVHGTRAYVANDGNGFAVYDITDPNNPVLLDQRRDATYAHSVFYDGGTYAYVGYGWSKNRELAIYDVSSLPLTPPVIYATGTGGLHDVYVAGQRAYAFSGQQLDILDVTNPISPVAISSVDLPANQYGVEGEVRVDGHYVFLAMGDASHYGGLRVVDISDESNPTVVASYDLPGGAGKMYAKGIGLTIADGRAYVAARGGLWVFDVSQPDSPVLAHNFALPTGFTNSMGAHVEVRDNLAYVTAYGLEMDASVGGLAIYKTRNVANQVAIDIKPGSDVNAINLRSKGNIPVAILSTDDFDATQVDVETVAFGPANATEAHGRTHVEDVDRDGDSDIVLHFRTGSSGLSCGDTKAELTAETFDGQSIAGTDALRTVACRRR